MHTYLWILSCGAYQLAVLKHHGNAFILKSRLQIAWRRDVPRYGSRRHNRTSSRYDTFQEWNAELPPTENKT